jgi:hypothetical protein
MNFKIKSLGEDYVKSNEFAFQEHVRKLSLVGFSINEKLFFNGWNQIWAMKLLFPQYEEKINGDFASHIKNVIEMLDTMNPNTNVRGVVKMILMWPHYPKFFDFCDYKNDQLLSICKLIKTMPNLAVHQNKIYLYLRLPGNFRDLVSECIPENGKAIEEDPHITIINSDEFEKFKNSPHIAKLCEKIIDDVEFYELSGTFSEDYPPYTNIVVVRCFSKMLENALEEFDSMLPEKGMFKIRKNFHFTIWNQGRDPAIP